MRSTRTIRRGLFRWVIPVVAVILIGSLVENLKAVPRTSRLGRRASRGRTAHGNQEGIPQFGHVFLIIGENTTYEHLTPTNAPYLMGTIRPQAAWLTQYFAATHWSQANYVALVSGQFTNCEQHDGGTLCHQNVDNLFHQLDVAGLTWKTWLEGGSAKCNGGSGGSRSSETACPLTGFYTTGNPAILFDDVEGANGVWSSTNESQECLQNVIPAGDLQNPMGVFNSALAKGQVANFNFIIPNGCDDGEANSRVRSPPGNSVPPFRSSDRSSALPARTCQVNSKHLLHAFLSGGGRFECRNRHRNMTCERNALHLCLFNDREINLARKP